MILFETEWESRDQPYLEALYKAIFLMGYYGMMRAGEIGAERGQFSMDHALKVKDIHVGINKQKILLVLYSSKTHAAESTPQRIKITVNEVKVKNNTTNYTYAHFCPFREIRRYMALRGSFDSDKEQFFIFRSKIPVMPNHISNMLKEIIKRLGLESDLYDFHSFTAGRTTDLFRLGYTIEQVKLLGRWKSNAVYRYIKL